MNGRNPAVGVFALALSLAAGTQALGVTVMARAQEQAPATRVVDAFEDVSGWSARPADGVELKVSADSGLAGRSMRLDFRFVKGGGYAVVHRDLSLDLPPDYEFRFAIRGPSPSENLEFKLVDSSGANVWWSNQRDYHFPAQWDSVRLRKRQIPFAWGPVGGGEIRHVAAIEFAITAGSGGSGTVWIDQLTLRERGPAPAGVRTTATASSSLPGRGPALAVDGNPATSWASGGGDPRPSLLLDLGAEREFGGLVVLWEPRRHLADYAVQRSEDGAEWRTVREVRGGNGGSDPLHLPESEARFLRIVALGNAPVVGTAIREITLLPLAAGATLEAFFERIASEAPRGSYPRGISGQMSYWTVVGPGEGRTVGLLNEDGMLETGKAQFSIEPFLYEKGRLIGWNDVTAIQRLERGDLPIPTTSWNRAGLDLSVTAFAERRQGASTMLARYRVRNRSKARVTATLFLALRPFQVNPPVQFLNTPGGMAPIRSIEHRGPVVRVNGDREILLLTPPRAFGATTFDRGDVTDDLRLGRVPPDSAASDPFACASAALAYAIDLAPGAEREVDLLVPLDRAPAQAWPGLRGADMPATVAAAQSAAVKSWEARLGRVTIDLPDSNVTRTLRSQLAYVFVNRDSVAIRPGTRAYARSWIRDGALTSSALLRLGQPEAVRDFIEWFAPYLYTDGKVPCCVDQRGSDPVPELDSNGEFIFLVAEYWRYTGDRALVERMWPAVARAAAYLDTLRQQRRGPEWRAPGKEHFFGLLPPSISHEGYSAKPMHSYWDDLFALRGFKDAALLASVLGHEADARRIGASRDEFQRELVASIEAAMRVHKIDYIPGCADLGDFDATSTTIALDPVAAGDVLPRAALERTFDRYDTFFRVRQSGAKPWEAFTPYEMRTIGAFVRLGHRDRALAQLKWFLDYRRPPGWNHWAEVVWNDARTPKFIGDMPHTWVGTDYARSVLDMIAYPREPDAALVVGAGLSWDWVSRGAGVSVRNLPTPYGKLDYTMRARGDSLEAALGGTLKAPAGGVVLIPPARTPFRSATVNGSIVPISADGAVVLRSFPATVVFQP